MAKKQEIEFIIRPDGQIEFTITGAPGAQCLPIAELFSVLGKTETEQATAEFYETPADRDGVVIRRR